MIGNGLKFFYVFLFIGILNYSQITSDFQSKKNCFTVPFTEINNLIIFPVVLNESTAMNMILDSGSPFTLILETAGLDELTIKKGKNISIGGLGHGYRIDAYDSRFNHLKVGKAIKEDTNLILIIDSPINLQKFLGTPVHGVVGYDVLKDFVVEINYTSRKLKFYKHNVFYDKKKRKISKHQAFPLTFHERKPYIKAKVGYKSYHVEEANLLVDTGGWDAVWWFEQSQPHIPLPAKNYQDTLGYGINGPITGHRSKTDYIELGEYRFNRPTTSFPDSASLAYAISHESRNGSIGGEILKRFNLIFDYKNQLLYLRPNLNFKNAFHYDMSGLKLEKPFVPLPFLEIVSIRPNSPAYHSGLKKGDLLVSINGNDIKQGELGMVNKLFSSKPGKKITVSLLRDGQKLSKSFYLTEPF